MTALDRLKDAEDLSDLSKLLGFTPKGISYVLYKLPDGLKYREFEIPKKLGGSRLIKAPHPQLSLLQRRLSELLYECVAEHKKKIKLFWRSSYGFQKGRTIVSNAEIHRRRRFVFNIDLEDFFGTINFGRVRGFFIHDRTFSLNPAVATIIAQIACHNNSLPQGSPCSPVVSNLVGNILDTRMLALANHNRCTYSRYADDITFSTNEVLFPDQVAVNVHGSEWVIGKKLRAEIEGAGFRLNDQKTRMSLHRSRQTVTGLVVNAKANVNQNYYRAVRSMCHALFQAGVYRCPKAGGEDTTESLGPLEGMLSWIHFVKMRRDRSARVNKLAIKAEEFTPPQAPKELYRRFLFYKYFVAPSATMLVTEGVSDIIYIQCAIRALFKTYPSLAKEVDGKVIRRVRFLKSSITNRDVLSLGHGSAGQAALVGQYKKAIEKYAHRPMLYPVIMVCDNDDGPKTLFKNVSAASGITVSTTTTNAFYHIGLNLYLVKVPEGAKPSSRMIEDLFDNSVLTTKLGGKPFDRHKEHEDETAYGKVVFAEKVIRENAGEIDFSGFSELLSRIDECISHYETIKASAAAAVAAAKKAS